MVARYGSMTYFPLRCAHSLAKQSEEQPDEVHRAMGIAKGSSARLWPISARASLPGVWRSSSAQPARSTPVLELLHKNNGAAQNRQCRNRTGRRRRIPSCRRVFEKCPLTCLQPVSYTHLDVYKRQGFRLLGEDVRFHLLPLPANLGKTR